MISSSVARPGAVLDDVTACGPAWPGVHLPRLGRDNIRLHGVALHGVVLHKVARPCIAWCGAACIGIVDNSTYAALYRAARMDGLVYGGIGYNSTYAHLLRAHLWGVMGGCIGSITAFLRA